MESKHLAKHPRVMVTGGAGFIGSNLVRMFIQQGRSVLVFDKLSYAGHRASLADLDHLPSLEWCIADLCELDTVQTAIATFQPDAIVHLAAESHVDRSINAPIVFAQSNVLGTVCLLEAARFYWMQLQANQQMTFRFLHVSTDEVFGSLGENGSFDENSPYRPNSPYAASKASADHFVRSFRHTFQLPVNITNCSNNYGPYQHPEKLIPVVIEKALAGEEIPIYGDGNNVRDWLYVADHCIALGRVLQSANANEDYIIGAMEQSTNLNLARSLCDLLDEMHPRSDCRSYRKQIKMVPDRLGHDFRYSVDPTKIMNELNWAPTVQLAQGLRKTVQWYLINQKWWQDILIDARK